MPELPALQPDPVLAERAADTATAEPAAADTDPDKPRRKGWWSLGR
jgi:hypothetical protein